MIDPKDADASPDGFPSLEWNGEDLTTRPMGLDELPRQFRIDQAMEVVTRHHPRIAQAIRTFWGHRDCVEYLQTLILKGGYSDGLTNRVGFKDEVLSALMRLASLHDQP